MNDGLKTNDLASSMTSKKRSVEDRHWMYSDVEVTVKDKDGNIKHHSIQKNLRTNAGADFWNTQLFSTSQAAGNQANWIGITADTTAPAATDTSLASEQTANGLARAQGTVAHTGGQSSTVISHTWTYSGSSSVTIAKAGLFTAAGPPVAGTMALETLLASTATVNSNGDQITINWTINF